MGWNDVIIGPHRVKVKVCKLKDKDIAGQEFFVESNEIHIAEGMPISQEIETLLHEVVHCWISVVPLGNRMDEIIAGVVGRSLAAFLTDNPTTIRRILKLLKQEDEKCQTK